MNLLSRPQPASPLRRARCLVVSNCQTVGLLNSLSLQRPDIDFEACDVWGLQQDLARWKGALPGYDHLVLSPEAQQWGLKVAQDEQRVIWLPGINFYAFHPDLCHASVADAGLKGPLDDYHSTIVMAGFLLGLTPARVEAAFDRRLYDALGYLDLWVPERTRLMKMYADVGIDIGAEFLRWTRQGVFMYSINHPRMTVIWGLARLIASRLPGEPPVVPDFMPHDNLASGAVFPVYPEIAESLGIQGGSYRFKPQGQYRTLGLAEFIRASYSAYEAAGRDRLRCLSPYFDRATALLKVHA